MGKIIKKIAIESCLLRYLKLVDNSIKKSCDKKNLKVKFSQTTLKKNSQIFDTFYLREGWKRKSF
jgi:hypothetical protein